MSRKSWLTSTMPPSQLLMARAKESMVSMSRWFVGSSCSGIQMHEYDVISELHS